MDTQAAVHALRQQFWQQHQGFAAEPAASSATATGWPPQSAAGEPAWQADVDGAAGMALCSTSAWSGSGAWADMRRDGSALAATAAGQINSTGRCSESPAHRNR